MKTSHFLKGVAVMALGLTVVACNKMSLAEPQQISSEQVKANAEAALGVTIDANQTWIMTEQVKATVGVNLKAGQSYKVEIFSNDPIAEGKGVVLAEGTVANGKTLNTTFTAPKGRSCYIVGATSIDNVTRYVDAVVTDGVLTANFGASTTRSNRAINVRGDVYEQFNFPSEAEIASQFPTSIPGDAEEVDDLESLYVGKQYTTQWGTATASDLYAVYQNFIGKGHNLKVTRTGEVTIGANYMNIVNGEYQYYNVYVSVEGNLTIKRQGDPHFNLYILKGNVTLDSSFGEMSGTISVGSGTTLNDPRNSIAANGGVWVFNRGTINATNTQKYDIGNKSTIYNQGIFDIKGAMTYSPGAGNTSYFINMGDGNDETIDLKAKSMTLNSTCHFYTAGKVDIEGETAVTQNEIVWINNGHYTTGSMKFSAHNGTFYNYCQLIVEDNCAFLDGMFNMMKDSYAEFGTGVFNNFHVNMADNSSVNIKNGTKFGQQGAGILQGFFANDNNCTAYVRMGGQVDVPAHKGSALQISGAKLTLAYKTMKFWEGYNLAWDGSYSGTSYWTETTKEALVAKKDERTTREAYEGATYAQENEVIITRPAEYDCSAGISESGKEKENTYEIYSYAFEDTWTGDYDLNDVVLKAQETRDGKINLTLVAVGATLDLNIRLYPAAQPVGDEVAHYTGEPTILTYQNETEVHAMLGVTRGTMVNTGSGERVAPITITIDKGSYNPAALPLAIYSTSQGEICLAGTGQAPYGVMVPMDWKWPTERVNITTAYNKVADENEGDQSFGTFAHNYGKALNWFNHPTGSVMK